jgi:hypothetical protein
LFLKDAVCPDTDSAGEKLWYLTWLLRDLTQFSAVVASSGALGKKGGGEYFLVG